MALVKVVTQSSANAVEGSLVYELARAVNQIKAVLVDTSAGNDDLIQTIVVGDKAPE